MNASNKKNVVLFIAVGLVHVVFILCLNHFARIAQLRFETTAHLVCSVLYPVILSALCSGFEYRQTASAAALIAVHFGLAVIQYLHPFMRPVSMGVGIYLSVATFSAGLFIRRIKSKCADG